MDRRTFIANAARSGAALTLATPYWQAVFAAAGSAQDRPMPKRPYNENVALSVIGFGGIVLMGQEQPDATREVARAVDRGVNYFDCAPSYGDGEAEDKLGPALQPHRDKVFLAEKTHHRGADGARKDLETSLKRLRTDHFDLYQLHAMTTPEDVEGVFGPDGAMEVLTKARAAGKVRYLGFSAHNEDVALDLLERFEWDSVLFPINYVCVSQGDFGPRLLARCKEKGVAVLALKALAYTPWASDERRQEVAPKLWYQPLRDLEKAKMALRFTLSEDVVAAIPPGDERVYRIAENLAGDLPPLTEAERTRLLATTANLTPIFAAG